MAADEEALHGLDASTTLDTDAVAYDALSGPDRLFDEAATPPLVTQKSDEAADVAELREEYSAVLEGSTHFAGSVPNHADQSPAA